ncbi:MAG: uroporphyrinogen decarboxylase family protein [Planctomycetota bacterium]|jgi:uroporphyrinogen decarboxylase
MIAKQRVKSALNGQGTDRPLFCPAIYEHKAKLLGKSPSEASQSTKLLESAVLAEYETYQPDLLTIGIDVYNVEAEALGSTVHFPDAIDAVPVIKDRLVASLNDLSDLKQVDPSRSARMPVVVAAAEAVNKKLGNEVFIRGAVSAPYSMAVELVGIARLLLATIDEPDAVDRLLGVCSQVSTSYSRAFLQAGVEVCLFDSYAAPPLLSPEMSRRLILPHVKKLIADLKDSGAEFIEYVIGGQTEAIADSLFATGADILLSDFACDIDIFLERAKGSTRLVRRNISPILIERGPQDELETQANAVAQLAAQNQNVIIGTGAISYNTGVEQLLKVRTMCLDYYDRSKCK